MMLLMPACKLSMVNHKFLMLIILNFAFKRVGDKTPPYAAA